MTPTSVLTTHSLIAIGFAIPLLFEPADFLWLYGAEPGPDGIYLARLFGGALVAVSAMTWMAREAPEGVALDAICLGLGLGCAVGFAVSVLRQFTADTASPLGWTTVTVFGGLTVAYVLLWIGRKARRQAPPRLQAG